MVEVKLPEIRIGQGYDVHQLIPGNILVLGTVKIPHKKQLKGHSDADVLLHAIIDAVLGALSLGDIGQWFPDTDSSLKGIASSKMLKEILENEKLKDWQLINLDSTIIAQQPKLSPYINEMRIALAKLFHVDCSRISIKATTTEKLGFTGKEQGIAAQAITLFAKK